jgi:hypothetical protein
MKYLARHTFNDLTALDQLDNSKARIGSVLRAGGKGALVELYGTYAACVNNPIASSSKLIANGIFSSLLIDAYESPPNAVAPLKEAVQDKVSPIVCPMCGSLKTGTADHYFPKKQYPEFSIYSWNLVPACDCNTKRGSTLFGEVADEWIIHPYFETKLAQRILTVTFDFSMAEPSLSIGKLYSSGIPAATIDFHVQEVHLKTTMLDWVTAEWARLRKVPCDVMTWYPSAVVSPADVKTRLLELMKANDNKLETPNNWPSALFHGVSESQPAIDMVTVAINDFCATNSV